MERSVTDILDEPLKVHYKPGAGNKKYPYVKGEDVVRRLNQAFDYEWSSDVLSEKERDGHIVVLVKISYEKVSHVGFGGAEIATYRDGPKKGQMVDYSNSYKTAYINALKKAAEQFGIGLGISDNNQDHTKNINQSQRNLPERPQRSVENPSEEPVTGSVTIKNRKAEGSVGSGMSLAEIRAIVEKKMSESKGDKSVPQTQSSTDKVNDVQKHALNSMAKSVKVSPAEVISVVLPDSDKKSFSELTKDEGIKCLKYLRTASQKSA